jgi:copper chaperone CopZ
MNEIVYTVTGMSCGHCADAVTGAIGGLTGVEHVSVEVDSGQVTVRSADPLPIESVRAAVDDAGYRLAGA